MQSFLANRTALTSDGRTPAAARTDFQPLFGGRLPDCRQREDSDVTVTTAETPKIELVQENGQIRGIIVVCGCGERIELQCEF